MSEGSTQRSIGTQTLREYQRSIGTQTSREYLVHGEETRCEEEEARARATLESEKQHERDLESLNWVLKRKNTKPFSAQILRKAVAMSGGLSVEVAQTVGLLLQHNTHPIDEQIVKSVANNELHGKALLKVLLDYDKRLVVNEELILNAPGLRSRTLQDSPIISDLETLSADSSADELEENDTPTWDQGSCPTCHDLRHPLHLLNSAGIAKKFRWSELCSTISTGCRFCEVLKQGLVQFVQTELCDCQSIEIDFRRSGPLRVRLDYDFRCENTHPKMTRLEFYMHAGTPSFAPAIRVARSVSTDASKDECMALVKDWLEECLCNHEKCPESLVQMPTRVLKVGSARTNPMLHVTKGGHDTYVALSHCWGASQVISTTIDTVQERMQGITMESLPKTFHDAVVITRRLGIEYLWIDSLCILQDSPEDWAREAAKMAAVYSGATVVIAADAARSSVDGCFGPYQYGPKRNLSVTIPCVNDQGLSCQVHVRKLQVKNAREALEHHELYGGRFPKLPLGLRAWSLQERLLAPRILHYCFAELAWECRSYVHCECDTNPYAVEYSVDRNDMQYRARLLRNLALLRQEACGIKGPEHRDEEHWHELVTEYTRLNLTYHSDRLAALSGLAALYQRPSDDYFCGLWRSELVPDLLWRVKTIENARTSHAQQTYQAPSWSWASNTGEIEYDMCQASEDAIEILDVQYTLASSNPFGAFKEGSYLIVRGGLLSIQLNEDSSIHLESVDQPYESSLRQSRSRVGDVMLDVHTGEWASYNFIVSEPLFLTIVQKSSSAFKPQGILLRRVEGDSTIDTFRRVGYVGPEFVSSNVQYAFAPSQNLLLEVAYETAEPQVFKII